MLSSYARVVFSLSFTHPRFQRQHTSGSQAPTFVDMRQRMERVWSEFRNCQEDVQWAGIFGSIARDRAGDGSDVDVLMGFTDHILSIASGMESWMVEECDPQAKNETEESIGVNLWINNWRRKLSWK